MVKFGGIWRPIESVTAKATGLTPARLSFNGPYISAFTAKETLREYFKRVTPGRLLRSRSPNREGDHPNSSPAENFGPPYRKGAQITVRVGIPGPFSTCVYRDNGRPILNTAGSSGP